MLKKITAFLVLVNLLFIPKVYAADTVSPSTVENFEITEVSDKTVKLKWNAATDDTGVANYNIYYGEVSIHSANGQYTSVVNVGNVTTYTLSNLTNNRTYFFSISALDAVGNESEYYSNEVSARPPDFIADTTTPSDVENLKAEAGNQKITLTWDASTDNQQIKGYNIYYGTETVNETSGAYTVSISAENVTSYEITGLINGTKYYFALTAVDTSNNESDYYSDEVSATSGETQNTDTVEPSEDPVETKIPTIIDPPYIPDNDEEEQLPLNNEDNTDSNSEDQYGNNDNNDTTIDTSEDSESLKNSSMDSESPYIKSAQVLTEEKIKLTFSEKIILSSQPKNNFTIYESDDPSDELLIKDVYVNSNSPHLVYLSTEKMDSKKDYVIETQNITDSSGNKIEEGKHDTINIITPAFSDNKKDPIEEPTPINPPYQEPENIPYTAEPQAPMENQQPPVTQPPVNEPPKIPTSGTPLILLAISAFTAGIIKIKK